MIKHNRVSKYLLYAIGEIVLVVVGILIALQINNSNEARKTRTVELTFLNNINEDLQLNLKALEEFIEVRNKAIQSSDIVLNYFEHKKPLDLNHFNYHSLNVMDWYPFHPHDNTYQELLNSGQLSLISNKSIKDHLQNMQSRFKTIAFIENEMQQDFESYLYDHYFNLIDLNTSLKNYNQQLNNDKIETEISITEIEELLNNKTFKNGFVLSTFNSNKLIDEYAKMLKTTQELMALIDEELAKN